MLRDISIKRKLILIAMLSSMLALVVASAALMAFDYYSLRMSLQGQMLTLAEITGNRSTAALVFDDEGLASENLAALGEEAAIDAACIYDTDEALFASFERHPEHDSSCDPNPPADGSQFVPGGHLATVPIELSDERLGTIAIQSNLDQLNALMMRFLAVALLVIFLAGAAAFLLARQLRRLVSEPIDHLARTAVVISKNQDYSLRAVQHGKDELGILVTTFNEMLDTIEQQNRALLDSKDQLEQTVEERTAELKAAQKVLLRQERLAALGQVTATVSHELRNPLGTIVNSLALFRRGAAKTNPGTDRLLGRIDRSIARCVRIIEELLAYTRVPELFIASADLIDLLKTVLGEQRAPDGVSITTRFEGPVMAKVDAERMRQAIINLLQNAWQAMAGDEGEDASGEIVVGCRAERGRALISVSDQGPGMSAEIRRQIFEPLFSTKAFGVGLGLPLVKHIMEQHGGGVEVETQEGEGTTMRLWLPLNREKVVDR